ncbi:MAG: hypothetical protein AAGI66_09855, partial [Cyanobacteria bacterium P01_H01_bin.74]
HLNYLVFYHEFLTQSALKISIYKLYSILLKNTVFSSGLPAIVTIYNLNKQNIFYKLNKENILRVYN